MRFDFVADSVRVGQAGRSFVDGRSSLGKSSAIVLDQKSLTQISALVEDSRLGNMPKSALRRRLVELGEKKSTWQKVEN